MSWLKHAVIKNGSVLPSPTSAMRNFGVSRLIGDRMWGSAVSMPQRESGSNRGVSWNVNRPLPRPRAQGGKSSSGVVRQTAF